MAALHAAFWGWRDDVGLTPLPRRYLLFSPAVAAAEAARGSGAVVPQVMAEGWRRLPEVSPAMAGIVLPLLEDPAPLVDALARVPHTLVHGDWKAANLGSQPDGRTVLLDFGEMPGEASPLADLSWYLALNAALLPEPKDAVLESYRAALERVRRLDIRLVGRRRRPRTARLHGPIRLGEGARGGRRRAVVVGGVGAARGASPG